MFSTELREKFHKCKQPMLDIENLFIEHQKRQFHSLSKPNNPNQLIFHNGIFYLQVLLSRSINLIEGVFIAANSRNPLMAILAVRAHFETTGALAFFAIKFDRFYSGTTKMEDMERLLQKLILGTRLCELQDKYNAPKSENVMNYIDAVDKVLSGLGVENKDSGFRMYYDFLSEFCHPNTYGLSLSHNFAEESAIFKTYPTISEKELSAITHLSVSVSLFTLLYDDILEKILRKGELYLEDIANFKQSKELHTPLGMNQ